MIPETKPRAVILLSGGLDSATTLAIARDQGFELYTLTFQYCQRHSLEIHAASELARVNNVEKHLLISLDLSVFGKSALTDKAIKVPKNRSSEEIAAGIPITYVPARNTIFLSYALAYAESIAAADIFIGVNILDYSGYPDCRPEYIKTYEKLANLATKAGVEGREFRIHTPLIDLNKAQIIATGRELGVDYRATHSCYDPSDDGSACGQCDSCLLRKKGFSDAGIPDPTRYVGNSLSAP